MTAASGSSRPGGADARPRRISVPDRSALDVELTLNLFLLMTVGRAFPPGDAQFLVTTFVRSTEVALRGYEMARAVLEESVANDSLGSYVRGLGEMESTFISLNRAMRVAVAIVGSQGTSVSNRHIPAAGTRDRLRAARNAIEHNEQAILDGRAGQGKTLALHVREDDSVIDDDAGTLVITHAELADWLSQLHQLAVDLTNDPGRWAGVGGP